MNNVGNIIQKLAVCGGALGLAFSGIELAYGDEQTAAKAKKKIIVIIAATSARASLMLKGACTSCLRVPETITSRR